MQLIKTSKFAYYKSELNKVGNNLKLKWKILGNVMTKCKKQKSLNEIVMNNVTIYNTNEHPEI